MIGDGSGGDGMMSRVGRHLSVQYSILSQGIGKGEVRARPSSQSPGRALTGIYTFKLDREGRAQGNEGKMDRVDRLDRPNRQHRDDNPPVGRYNPRYWTKGQGRSIDMKRMAGRDRNIARVNPNTVSAVNALPDEHAVNAEGEERVNRSLPILKDKVKGSVRMDKQTGRPWLERMEGNVQREERTLSSDPKIGRHLPSIDIGGYSGRKELFGPTKPRTGSDFYDKAYAQVQRTSPVMVDMKRTTGRPWGQQMRKTNAITRELAALITNFAQFDHFKEMLGMPAKETEGGGEEEEKPKDNNKISLFMQRPREIDASRHGATLTHHHPVAKDDPSPHPPYPGQHSRLPRRSLPSSNGSLTKANLPPSQEELLLN